MTKNNPCLIVQVLCDCLNVKKYCCRLAVMILLLHQLFICKESSSCEMTAVIYIDCVRLGLSVMNSPNHGTALAMDRLITKHCMYAVLGSSTEGIYIATKNDSPQINDMDLSYR